MIPTIASIIMSSLSKCFVLKELILWLACEKKIELELEEVARINHVLVTMMSDAPPSTSIFLSKRNFGPI